MMKMEVGIQSVHKSVAMPKCLHHTILIQYPLTLNEISKFFCLTCAIWLMILVADWKLNW